MSSKKDQIKRQSQQIANGNQPQSPKTLPGKAPEPTSTSNAAAQSIAQLQQAQGDFQTFQSALAAQLQAMQQATVATARQAAEIKNSMPLLFEQEFAARDAELRGTPQAGFPKPQFEPIAAFEVSTAPRLIAASGDADSGTALKAIPPRSSVSD